MNRTLRALSFAAFSLAALQANAAMTGESPYYPAGMRSSTSADASAAAAVAATTMASPTRSSYVWRGDEAGLTLENGPVAGGSAGMKDSHAMPQPAGSAGTVRREPIFLGA